MVSYVESAFLVSVYLRRVPEGSPLGATEKRHQLLLMLLQVIVSSREEKFQQEVGTNPDGGLEGRAFRQ
jgi:hypothetical protein